MHHWDICINVSNQYAGFAQATRIGTGVGGGGNLLGPSPLVQFSCNYPFIIIWHQGEFGEYTRQSTLTPSPVLAQKVLDLPSPNPLLYAGFRTLQLIARPIDAVMIIVTVSRYTYIDAMKKLQFVTQFSFSQSLSSRLSTQRRSPRSQCILVPPPKMDLLPTPMNRYTCTCEHSNDEWTLMMTCSVNKQLTVSLAGVSMAIYLSLHLAVFTGLG